MGVGSKTIKRMQDSASGEKWRDSKSRLFEKCSNLELDLL